ncbi:MAG: SDR family oxidoreductase [Trueperaceae bacterium]|nr:SDR family oxidoreductase [Trueperaceae bacterium]
MNLGIANKTALVTGGSQGIGFAVAKLLAAEGVRVVLAARSQDTLDAAVTSVRDGGGDADAIRTDVSDAADIDRLLQQMAEQHGGVDILVVNAGGPPTGPAHALDDDAWADGYELTLMSAVRLARGVVPAMRERGWGRIINITSVSVKQPIPNLTLSNAFRAAVTGFAKTLSNEVAADGVTVNNVAPGYTATERLSEVVDNDEARARILSQIPAGRFADPDEIAAAAVFLASQQAAYITGQTIKVDGGHIRAVD